MEGPKKAPPGLNFSFCGKKICSLYEGGSVSKPVLRVRHFYFMLKTFNTLLFLKLYYNNNINKLRNEEGVRKKMSEKELAKKLAKEIIEEIKEFLKGRADALNLKSTHRSIERSIKKILREHASDFDIEEVPKGGIQPFDERG